MVNIQLYYVSQLGTYSNKQLQIHILFKYIRFIFKKTIVCFDCQAVQSLNTSCLFQHAVTTRQR